MNELSQADQLLLAGIRRGEAESWTQLVDRYRGRLLAFARARVRCDADAEDLLQDTFICFLRGLPAFRGESGLETYLFTILRRRVVDWYRGRKLSACLLQDLVSGDADDDREGPLGSLPAPDPTASWYARRDEQDHLQREALGEALRLVIDGYKESLNFRDLKIVEMLFFSQLPNKEVAARIGLDEKQVALIKHRVLKKVAAHVQRRLRGGSLDVSRNDEIHDAMLTEVWSDLRASCPKRSTIGAGLLGTLDGEWRDYVEFHLHTLGCRFCLANLEDLKRATSGGPARSRDRILNSTIGFLKQSYLGPG